MGVDLTVVVPNRNCNELIGNAIASIKAQDVPCNVIVIDNASDTPPLVLPDVAYVYHSEDMGIPRSLDEGYRIATTPYCCMVGADDTIESGWFSTALTILEAQPEMHFVSPGGSRQLSWPDILNENYMHMGAICRRDTVLRVGGYRHVPFFDWDLWIRLAKAGVQGVSLPTHFYNWIPREGSDSTRFNGDDYERFVAQLREEYTS